MTNSTYNVSPDQSNSDAEKKSLLDEWNFYSVKTKKSIWYIGSIFLITDLLALSKANLLNATNVVFVMIVPLFYTGIGYLAKSRPMIAMVLAAILFVAVLSLSVFSYGAGSLATGFLLKLV
ncbi:MAG: hypothetical protein ACXWB9_03480, partial [Flavisolibacter sp.]